jgi:phytoene dehydrogenase-like protein
MKSGESYSNSRRGFLKGAGALMVLAWLGPLAQSCREKLAGTVIRLMGTNHVLGHRLWAKSFPKPASELTIPYLIIGGGITGLSAARQLVKRGIDDFLLIEMEDHLGGNSSGSENKYSRFPLGAHYLPLPNFHDKELLDFLEEEKIITGYNAKGFPVFDEQQLTFSPQERLFYNNTWQEGLIPKFGLPPEADDEFGRFFMMMDNFRNEKGSDGRFFFDIPLSSISEDKKYTAIDTITMEQWLNDKGFRTLPLKEYVDYCCRDDFGLGIAYVSAWAGIHYFAARKHNGGEYNHDNVLTWPEGNARLATHLKRYSKGKTQTGWLAFDVSTEGDKVIAKAFDAVAGETVTIAADKVIIAAPQFVNQYLLPDRKKIARHFTYAPWLLATLTLREFNEEPAYPLSWDNVIHGGRGLGYIHDQHQMLGQLQDRIVITYYHSFSTNDSKKTRKDIYRKKEDYWKDLVLSDLHAAHPSLAEKVEEISIHLLGHGMISPTPGFLFGSPKVEAARPVAGKIYFAHSDLSGISIFEEAFHQGVNIVNRILDEAALDT